MRITSLCPYSFFVSKIIKTSILPWIENVNGTYIRGWQDVLKVFWAFILRHVSRRKCLKSVLFSIFVSFYCCILTNSKLSVAYTTE